MKLFNSQYSGRRVLLTGHTGFKGSWLALWLQQLDAEVTGVALPPETNPNHWDLLKIPIAEHLQDIRDSNAIAEIIIKTQPEIVFHLAAQPLVRRSYRQPLDTWSSNVIGTANVLEACRRVNSIKAIVVITSDKCYRNQEWHWGYRETDPLGGHDPYSASKAATELLVDSYRHSFFQSHDSALLATARAGNVIGGGDWSEDRLIPDLVRAINQAEPTTIRNPQATRPWQHVLESLSGYLLLGEKLLEGQQEYAESWNFGPKIEGNRTVAQVLDELTLHWPELKWQDCANHELPEANLLYLDSMKAQNRMGWQPVWTLSQTLAETAAWYRHYSTYRQAISAVQLSHYIDTAQHAQIAWTQA